MLNFILINIFRILVIIHKNAWIYDTSQLCSIKMMYLYALSNLFVYDMWNIIDDF